MKTVTTKIKWIFAIGQLGWSILSGIISNLLQLDSYMLLFIFMSLVTFICYIPVNMISRKVGRRERRSSKMTAQATVSAL